LEEFPRVQGVTGREGLRETPGAPGGCDEKRRELKSIVLRSEKPPKKRKKSLNRRKASPNCDSSRADRERGPALENDLEKKQKNTDLGVTSPSRGEGKIEENSNPTRTAKETNKTDRTRTLLRPWDRKKGASKKQIRLAGEGKIKCSPRTRKWSRPTL